MKFFKAIGHWLALPFVCLIFGIRMLKVKSKYNRYLNYPDSFPIDERYYFIYKLVKNALFIKNIKVESTGFSKSPAIYSLYVVNHKSSIDALIIFKLLYESKQIPYFRFVAKDELNKKINRFNMCFRLIDTIFINRADIRSISKIYNSVNISKDKRSVVVFIEGTRIYENNKLGEFHAGSLSFAYKSATPIVPIVLYGSSGLMKDDKVKIKINKKYKKVYVNCLDKLKPNSYITTTTIHTTNFLYEIMNKELQRMDTILSKSRKNVHLFDELDNNSKFKKR